MGKKLFNSKTFIKYIFGWLLTGFVMLALIWQMYGDARVINYSGIVRGITQKIVKEELNGIEDDALIQYIDDIIYNLQTGEGDYNLVKFNDAEYQEKLSDLTLTWDNIKSYIYEYRMDESCYNELYKISEFHYKQADEMVTRAEKHSEQKYLNFIYFYIFSVLAFIVIFISINKLNSEKFETLKTRDSLTGSFTPYAFQAEVEKVLKDKPKDKNLIAVFDMQNFKSINATYGYDAGDEILRNIAKFLLEHDFLVSRVALDEFFVLMPWCEDTKNTLEHILFVALKDTNSQTKLDLNNISFRYGICPLDEKYGNVKSVMDKAIVAHKLARQEEKSVIWCDEKLIERLEKEAYCEENLPKAIANKEFKVYLQAQVDLKTGQIVGAESLVRWQLKNDKILYPDEFIPVFERKGLIKYLDYYMLEEVCKYQNKQQKANKKLHMISVNFSRVTLAENDFYEKILFTVNKYKIPYQYVGIEVVETALNNMDNNTIKLLNDLKNTGFAIAMDDFGAGYSSLGALCHLPVTILKLDRDFLWGIDENEKMKHVITLVVNMSHHLGIKVLCEGVETKNQVEFLKEVGCDVAQGYYYAKPIPKEDFQQI